MMNSRSIMQAALAVAALALGLLVYALDRPLGSARFIPEVLQLNAAGGQSFGRVGASLPSFLHIYAFILLTMAVLRPDHRTLSIVCGTWLGIEVLFELGQHLTPHRLLASIDMALPIPAGGIFDPWDIAALALGAIAAFLTTVWITGRAKL